MSVLTFSRSRLFHHKKFPDAIPELVIYLLVVNSLFSAVVNASLGFWGQFRAVPFFLSLFFVLFFAAFLWPVRRGHVQVATLVAIGINFSLTILQVWLDGGIQSPNYLELLLNIFLATLAFGYIGGLFSTACSLTFILLSTFFQAQPTILSAQAFMVFSLTKYLAIGVYFTILIRMFKDQLKNTTLLAQSLSESEAKLRELIINLPIGGLVFRASGEVELVNNRLIEEFGFGREQLKTSADFMRLINSDPEQVASADQHYAELTGSRSNPVKEIEGLARNQAGDELYVNVFYTRLGEDWIVLVNDITARKKAEREIARKLAQLSSLRTLDIAIIHSEKLSELVDIFLQQIAVQLTADGIGLMICDCQSEQLQDLFTYGFSAGAPSLSREPSAELHALLVRPEPSVLDGADAVAAVFGPGAQEFHHCVCVPLHTRKGVIGLFSIFHHQRFIPDADWLRFFEALAGQTAIGVERIHLNESLKNLNRSLVEAYNTTLQGWARALELRDKETEGHSRRVAEMTIHLAQAAGVPESDLQDYYRGAWLHDIGKMGIPDQILQKPDKLTDEEWMVMREHPGTAYQLLKNIPYLRRALEIPYCHHERWDGEGYPRGLRGEQIPLSARIFAIADVWDALTSDRPYRPAWSAQQVRDYILARSGTQFDPQVVRIFAQMIETTQKEIADE